MDRAAFNGWAEAAVQANEPGALALLAADLAARHLTVRSKRGRRRAPAAPQLREEFRAVMVAAAVDRAHTWTPADGDFYSVIGRAIRGAFDEHARAGGYSTQVTWRGAYSTDKRAFSSQVPKKHKETAGSDALKPEDAADQGDPDARAHMPHASDADAVAEQARAESESAEYTPADQSDSEQPATKEFSAEGRRHGAPDADSTKGLESATRGLFSGSVMLNPWARAALDAFEGLAARDRHLYEQIEKAGSLKRYIAQGRKKQAAHWEAEYSAMLRRWDTKTREIAKARRLEWGAEPAPGWTGANTVDSAALLRVSAPPPAAGRQAARRDATRTTGGPVSMPDGRESRTVYRSPGRGGPIRARGLEVHVRGLGWSDLTRNAREWERSPDRPQTDQPLSLLHNLADLLDEWGNPRGVVSVVTPRRPTAWPSVPMVIAVSLLDTVTRKG